MKMSREMELSLKEANWSRAHCFLQKGNCRPWVATLGNDAGERLRIQDIVWKMFEWFSRGYLRCNYCPCLYFVDISLLICGVVEKVWAISKLPFDLNILQIYDC